MMILLLLYTFSFVLSAFVFKEKCQKGLIEPCYDTEIFNVLLPVNHTDYMCDRFLYWTEEIDESIKVSLTVAAVVLQIEGITGSKTEDCKLNQLHKYNVTLRVKLDEFVFVGNDTYDSRVDGDNVMNGIYSIESKYSERVFMKQILDDLAGEWVLDVPVPAGKTTAYVEVEYVHPVNKYDCVLKIMVFTCYVKFLLVKVIGAVLGGIFLISSIVCCPLILLVCALLYCKGRASRKK